MWETKITSLLGITFPIVQGGLAYLAYSNLAAAVSNSGGLGQITAMSLESPEELRKEIKLVRQKTAKPFGVNFAIGQHGRPFEHMLDVAIEENVPVITVTGGNPTPLFKRLKGTNIKTLVLVAEKRQAQKAEELGADAVIVVGHEGGGHLGRSDTGSIVLIPQIVDAISIPVIASGGIADGRGVMAAFALGADGVEMGTRFIATTECVHAHQHYRDHILAASEEDTVVIKKSLGTPARALRTNWTEKIINLERELKNPTFEDLKPYITAAVNKAFIHEGDRSRELGWAGQVVGRIHDIPSVEELFKRIETECKVIQQRWGK
ncbi:NAD(P)H-dependent flavin oxidoreductase [Halalkalibacter urbisdiaboli]|uniref:NAD(P)H-dependent flavin oxidoreductase n=1 Tax=Halalkalibacter urbisdiaboli TaxID=1960589 RepID=UPI000B452FD5|nr:nitronate monooxygenase family protein [Halalkalibacter urbisdiaboli]